VQRQEYPDASLATRTQERKILNIYGNKCTGPLGGATSCALGGAHAPALRPRPLARLVRRTSHIRAHDTHCIMLGPNIGANDKAPCELRAHRKRRARTDQHDSNIHYVEQPRPKTQRSPFAAEGAAERPFAPLRATAPRLERPGKPRCPPALKPCSRALKGPCRPMHCPSRPCAETPT